MLRNLRVVHADPKNSQLLRERGPRFRKRTVATRGAALPGKNTSFSRKSRLKEEHFKIEFTDSELLWLGLLFLYLRLCTVGQNVVRNGWQPPQSIHRVLLCLPGRASCSLLLCHFVVQQRHSIWKLCNEGAGVEPERASHKHTHTRALTHRDPRRRAVPEYLW